MNDNQKKVLTDEELQEVSGGYKGGLINATTEGANNMTKPCGGYNTKESCEKYPKCKWAKVDSWGFGFETYRCVDK